MAPVGSGSSVDLIWHDEPRRSDAHFIVRRSRCRERAGRASSSGEADANSEAGLGACDTADVPAASASGRLLLRCTAPPAVIWQPPNSLVVARRALPPTPGATLATERGCIACAAQRGLRPRMGRIIEPKGSIPRRRGGGDTKYPEGANQGWWPGRDCICQEQMRTAKLAPSVTRGEAQDGPNHRTHGFDSS